MADVHVLPVQRKRGRRRAHQLPGAPLADVLKFSSGEVAETAEQQLARTREAVNTIAYHLLMAARAVRRISDPLA